MAQRISDALLSQSSRSQRQSWAQLLNPKPMSYLACKPIFPKTALLLLSMRFGFLMSFFFFFFVQDVELVSSYSSKRDSAQNGEADEKIPLMYSFYATIKERRAEETRGDTKITNWR